MFEHSPTFLWRTHPGLKPLSHVHTTEIESRTDVRKPMQSKIGHNIIAARRMIYSQDIMHAGMPRPSPSRRWDGLAKDENAAWLQDLLNRREQLLLSYVMYYIASYRGVSGQPTN